MFDQYDNKRLLNVAADLEINQYIPDEFKGETWEGLDIVNGEFKGVKLPPRAGTRVYYDMLQKELDEYGQQKGNGSGDGGDDGDNEDGGNENGSNDKTNGNGNGGWSSSEFAEWFNQGNHEGEHQLWEEFENLSEAEKKLIQKQIDHQLKEIAQSQRTRGTVPSELQSYIEKLFEKH